MLTKAVTQNPEVEGEKGKFEENEEVGSQGSLIDLKEIADSVSKNTVMVKASLKKVHRYIDDPPKSIKDLKKQIETLFEVKFDRKWRLFYFDSQFDRIDILKNRDLKTAYKVSSNKNDKILKIYIWDKEGSLPEHKDTKGTTFIDSASEQGRMIENMHKQNLPPYTIPKIPNNRNTPNPSVPSQTLDKMRENGILPQFLTKEENKNQKKLEFNLLKLQTLPKDELHYLTTLKHQIVDLLKEKEDLTFEEIENEFSKNPKYLSLQERGKEFLHHFIANTRERIKLNKRNEVPEDIKPNVANLIAPPPPQRMDPSLIVTSTRTLDDKIFGRSFFNSKIGSGLKAYAFFVSEFEIKTLKSNKNFGQNLYFETGLEGREGKYKQSLTLKILDVNCKLYIPIIHGALEEPGKEAYYMFFSWGRQELGTFLTPKTLIVDFEYDLYQACKEAYHNIQVVVCFNKMTKKFYQLAEQYKLIEDKVVTDRVRRLILSLKGLAFSIPGGVKDTFDKIRGEHSKDFMDAQDQYSSFISYINTTYCDRFSKIDWWNQNHAKLVFPEEIRLASNSDEFLTPIYDKGDKILYDPQKPGESNLRQYITALQKVENGSFIEIYSKYKTDEGEEPTIEDQPFTKAMKTLMEEELEKIFNFEETNEGLGDTEEALKTIGLKIEPKKETKEDYKPQIELKPGEEETTAQN